MLFSTKSVLPAMLAGVCTLTMSASVLATNRVNIYSFRQPFLIEPILAEFSKQTGIETNVVFAKKGMLERIKAEGRNTAADAVLAADVGRLHDMAEAGVLRPVASPTLSANIPAQYRHPDGLWFGLTTRARVLFASKERVEEGEYPSYESLDDPAHRGRICSRSGKHVYNVSLIASMLHQHGEAQTEEWLRGVKANLARRPQGNDRAQARAIYEGVCDIGLANTYYMGKMLTNEKKPEQKAWGESIRIIFPNQGDRGTHVNISGAAVTKYASNAKNAIKLIEFLSTDYAQRLYASQNYEYPVKPGVEIDPLVASWGGFKADEVNLAEVAKLRRDASKLVDKVGFDR